MSPIANPAQLAELVNAAKLATLGQLVAGIAHELNTPIGALHSNHDTLKRALGRLQDILADEVVDQSELAEVRRIVHAIAGVMRVNDLAIDRTVGLVSSLRNFGRPDQAAIDTVDVHESIDAALAILGHELRGRIEVVRDYGAVPPVECHPQQLGQAFMNLLVNAAQAISGTGTITVRTRASADTVTIELEDTGVGIPHDVLERIFEPGFTTKGARIGMGLGLLITRQIVDQHDGSINVRSTAGKGSVFTMTLPLRMRAAADSHPGRSA